MLKGYDNYRLIGINWKNWTIFQKFIFVDQTILKINEIGQEIMHQWNENSPKFSSKLDYV